jgi:hypothetical protein
MDEIAESQWDLIEALASQSSRLFLKKLSRNDTSWADGQGHQNGFYVPHEIRDTGFFPELRQRKDKPHIFMAACSSVWPQTGELKKTSLRHYSNKGHEAHFTVPPRDLFKGLTPASWLLGGIFRSPESEAHHWFIVIESDSMDAEILETALNIGSNFHFAELTPEQFLHAHRLKKDEADELIELITQALRTGSLSSLLAGHACMPTPDTLARQARHEYLVSEHIPSLNPFKIACPGDAIMKISRDIEYSIYRRHELRHRATEVVSLLHGNGDLVNAVVRGFPALDRLFLSASQQRKSRAGRSFESHLSAMLTDGGIRFEEQAILGGRRPDFVLPDKKTMSALEGRDYLDAVILSAKTTLRERWKQVTHERFNCAIFLATVDDRVSLQALDDLADAEITLVVPESLKAGDEAVYLKHSNVISFRTLFDSEIAKLRPLLISAPPAQ